MPRRGTVASSIRIGAAAPIRTARSPAARPSRAWATSRPPVPSSRTDPTVIPASGRTCPTVSVSTSRQVIRIRCSTACRSAGAHMTVSRRRGPNVSAGGGSEAGRAAGGRTIANVPSRPSAPRSTVRRTSRISPDESVRPARRISAIRAPAAMPAVHPASSVASPLRSRSASIASTSGAHSATSVAEIARPVAGSRSRPQSVCISTTAHRNCASIAATPAVPPGPSTAMSSASASSRSSAASSGNISSCTAITVKGRSTDACAARASDSRSARAGVSPRDGSCAAPRSRRNRIDRSPPPSASPSIRPIPRCRFGHARRQRLPIR